LWKRPKLDPQRRRESAYGRDQGLMATVVWTAASLAGVCAGGRFFGHYFFAVLPGLSLLGGCGLEQVAGSLRRDPRSTRTVTAAVVLLVLFLFSFYRFHHRTVVLAYETVTGTRTRFSRSWGMTQREIEAQDVARFVGQRVSPGEPLYVWGFSLDVYWWSGCRPASRFLTPNYLAGQFYPELAEASATANDPFWREAREQLIVDLSATRPRLILNTDQALYDLPFPEVREFIRQNYAYEGTIGSDPLRQFLVFRLKEKRVKTPVAPEATR
jgi:hypothetical protein